MDPSSAYPQSINTAKTGNPELHIRVTTLEERLNEIDTAIYSLQDQIKSLWEHLKEVQREVGVS
jgi:chromosome segregation ATPase